MPHEPRSTAISIAATTSTKPDNFDNLETTTSKDYQRITGSRRKCYKLDCDKYLSGRSFDLFRSAIRSDKTLIQYKYELWHFCDYVRMTTQEIIGRYGGENAIEVINLQRIIEDYIMLIQIRIKKNEIKAASAQVTIPSIKLFCEMNDIMLNWKKINRLLPRSDNNAADGAYTREQITKMLEYSDLRTKLPILFMASGGLRLGGFVGLRDGSVRPIYDDKTGKLLAAQVTVYGGTSDEYDTFITPETYSTYEQYRNFRIKFGERLTKESPILLRRFDISPNGKNLKLNNSKPLALSTIDGLIGTVAYKAGIRQVSQHYNKNRYDVKTAHGFRKFFNTILRGVKTKDGQPAIQYIHKEWMMGHALRDLHAMEENYDRSDRVKALLEDYMKAVPELTISDEERLKVEVKKLKTEISNMSSVSVELDEKDKQIETLREEHEVKMEAMREEMKQQYSKIMSLIQQNPVLAHVKPEVLTKKMQ